MPRSIVPKVILSVAALGLGVAGFQVPGLRRLVAYAAAILIMIYIGTLGGVFLASMVVKTRDFVPQGIGFFVGLAAGIAAGILLGRVASTNNVVYWLLILIVAGIIAWLKPLI